jgi:hypothetical protein
MATIESSLVVVDLGIYELHKKVMTEIEKQTFLLTPKNQKNPVPVTSTDINKVPPNFQCHFHAM